MLLALSACSADPPTVQSGDHCAELLSFRDQSSLDAIALVPDGYVLNAFGHLAGYDMQDTKRFEIPGFFAHFDSTDEGLVVAVSDDDGVVTARAWSPSGTSLGETQRIEDAGGALALSGAEVLDDGGLLAYGGSFGDWWRAAAVSGEPEQILRSETLEVKQTLGVQDGARYRVMSTITDPMGVTGHTDLSRVDSGGVVAWTERLVDREETQPFSSATLFSVAGGDAFVVIESAVDAHTRTLETRRYDADGVLEWSEVDEYGLSAHQPLPLALPSDATLFADRKDDTIRLRVVEDDGELRCEQLVPSHAMQHGVADLELVDDQLFVITIDRITRLRMLDPPA
ncbi:MAG: hypothetical protein AAF721_14510 [Myxococcota bacterium]